MPRKAIRLVEDIPNSYTFVDLSQDVKEVKSMIGGAKVKQFNSFFVLVRGGDISAAYGMHGTVPYLNKRVYKVYPRR